MVFTTLPDREAALRLASALVERRLAACVNVLAACTSVYRWQSALHREDEVPLIVKTRTALFPALEAAILELHPYEVPEVVAVPVASGAAAYLAWIDSETAEN